MAERAATRGMRVGDRLLRLLADRGVDTVFGVPGNHTVALYRGFADHGIRHITCRHEQGAAFMADGYARATGRPGVCVLISGPGLLNAATGIAQARADSVPLLVITGVAAVADLGMGRGTLHELPDQRTTAGSFCRSAHTLLDPANLDNLMDRAFALFSGARPGPVHLEIPLDLMEAPAEGAIPTRPALSPPGPDPSAIERAAVLLAQANAPLLLVGGGARHAAFPVVALAEALDCPVLNTVNGKGVCPASHPLATGGSPSLPALRQALGEADAVLVIGSELGETDCDLLMMGPLSRPDTLIRIDIDQDQLLVPWAPTIGICSDAALGARALADALVDQPPVGRTADGAVRAATLREAVRQETHFHPEMAGFFRTLTRAAPDALIVGDSTRPTYYAAWQLECERPGRYFHSASGFGTLGYALPAAIGAAVTGTRPVLALIGDGGLQFTLPELSTAAELALPLVLIVWQNDGYREIENSMRAKSVPVDSTRLRSPDLAAAAAAHHAHYHLARDLEQLGHVLSAALSADGPTLVEVREADLLTLESGGWYS